MNHQESIQLIQQTGVIAIMRAQSPDQLLRAADAIREGGVRVIEVTMTTPGALPVIEQATSRYGQDVLFGAGSVLDPESARAAILAGAQFIVSPSCKPTLIEICRRYSIPVMPGAYTPTEVLTAWESGADMVKVFPVSFGGSALIKALKAPLPQVGAAAVGVGSALINQKLLEAGDWAAITERAQRFIEEVARGRA